MELNQQEMQEFVLYIIEFAKQLNIDIQTEDELKAFAEQIGEEKMKQLYQQYLQSKRQAPKAKLGAKLNYLKKLKGECPEGETLKYFLKGGRICQTCLKNSLNTILNFKNSHKKSKKLEKGGNTPKWKLNKESYNGWGKGERWRVLAHNMFTLMDANQRAAFDTDGVEGLSRDEVINMQKSLGFTGRMLDGKIGRDTISRFEDKFGKLDYNDNGKHLIIGNYSPYLSELKNLKTVDVIMGRRKNNSVNNNQQNNSLKKGKLIYNQDPDLSFDSYDLSLRKDEMLKLIYDKYSRYYNRVHPNNKIKGPAQLENDPYYLKYKNYIIDSYHKFLNGNAYKYGLTRGRYYDRDKKLWYTKNPIGSGRNYIQRGLWLYIDGNTEALYGSDGSVTLR